MLTLQQDRIEQGIIETGGSPLALEAGARLVDDWIRTNHEADMAVRTVAVEMGFVLWADNATLVIGVQDRVAQDEEDLFGCEWKSTKEPSSKWWNEEKWLASIVNGPQLATYALALHEAAYLERVPGQEKPKVHNFFIDNPRIMVRAAVKSNPTDFWPKDAADGMYRFPNEKLKFVKAGLVNMAASIRAVRRTQRLPWQLTGQQCTAFNKQCSFFESCQSHNHPIGVVGSLFDPHDPAAGLALAHVEAERLADPDLVVLSASSYQTAARCKELYRIQATVPGAKDGANDLALATGSAMHGGLAEYYRQIKEYQENVEG